MSHREVTFSKYTGCGNDFVCIDNRDGRYDEMLASPQQVGRFAEALCDRHKGVGADGVIFACRPELPDSADIAARFIEADGSECDLCGNGTGCFSQYMLDVNGFEDQLSILTGAGLVFGREVEAGYVRVCIPSPEHLRTDLPVRAAGKTWLFDFALVGVAHGVTWVDDIDAVNVPVIGKEIRWSEDFGWPNVNVNFVEILDVGRIAIRTFESGVEAETLACGTGSSASAILTALRHDWPEDFLRGETPVKVRTFSGEELRVFFVAENHARVSDVCLETHVRRLYDGTLRGEFLARLESGDDA